MAAKKRAATREGMVVTTVALDEELHKRLAHAAIEDGAALTELMRAAIRDYLDAREKRLNQRRKK